MALPAQVDIALAATEESLYILPASMTATVRVVVVNRNSTVIAFRVAHVPGGGAAAGLNYKAFDRSCPGNEERVSHVFDMETVGAELRIESDTLNVTFQVDGVERDA